MASGPAVKGAPGPGQGASPPAGSTGQESGNSASSEPESGGGASGGPPALEAAGAGGGGSFTSAAPQEGGSSGGPPALEAAGAGGGPPAGGAPAGGGSSLLDLGSPGGSGAAGSIGTGVGGGNLLGSNPLGGQGEPESGLPGTGFAGSGFAGSGFAGSGAPQNSQNPAGAPSMPAVELTLEDRAVIAFQAGNSPRSYALYQAHSLHVPSDEAQEMIDKYRWDKKRIVPRLGYNFAVGLIVKKTPQVTDLKPIGTALKDLTSAGGGRGGPPGLSGGGGVPPGLGFEGGGGSDAGGSGAPIPAGVRALPAKELSDAAGNYAAVFVDEFNKAHSEGKWSEAFRDYSYGSLSLPPSLAGLSGLLSGGAAGAFGGGESGGAGGVGLGGFGAGGFGAGGFGGGAAGAGGAPAGYGGGGPPPGALGPGGPPAGYGGAGGPPPGAIGPSGPPAGYGGAGGPPPGAIGPSGPPAGYGGAGGPPPGAIGPSGPPAGYGGAGGPPPGAIGPSGPPAGYGGGGGAPAGAPATGGKSGTKFLPAPQIGGVGGVGGVGALGAAGGPGAGAMGLRGGAPGAPGPGAGGAGGTGLQLGGPGVPGGMMPGFGSESGGNPGAGPSLSNLQSLVKNFDASDLQLPSGSIPLGAGLVYIGKFESLAEMTKQANEQHYDALIVFEVDASMIIANRSIKNDCRIRAINLKAAKDAKDKSFTSSSLNNRDIAMDKTPETKIENAVNGFMQKLFEGYALDDLPNIPAESVKKKRLPALAADTSRTVLDRLAEVQLYFSKGLIDETLKVDAFGAIAGPDGQTLATGTIDEKLPILEKMIKRDYE